MTITAGIKGSITFTNNGTSSADLNGTQRMDFGFHSDMASVDALFSGIPGGDLGLSYTTGAQTVGGNGGVYSYDSGQLPITASLDLDLSTFVAELQDANGTFTISCLSVTAFTSNAGSNTSIGVSHPTTGGCGATVEYTYTSDAIHQAPEPGSLALVGLVMAGLTLRTRRKA
ncbi:MAG: PEP-CTERM sorting domain-containing protein [Ideonella sp.]|nr:PEP-CTERM sorting domain-containing protein [Ideonella sp.]